MKPLDPGQHRAALIRRRIKFVVEKGAMARLFPAGTHAQLQAELFKRIRPDEIGRLQTRDEYDGWLESIVELPAWAPFSRNGIKQDRWGYIAKLVNIVVYEIVANRELFAEVDWRRIQPFLHLPIDAMVSHYLTSLDSTIPSVLTLKNIRKRQYFEIQHAARVLAARLGVPPIWFEAAWSA